MDREQKGHHSMSQNEKRLFDRHKKQEELPLEQTQAVPAVQDEITAEPAARIPTGSTTAAYTAISH